MHDRLERVRALLAERGLDAVLVTNPSNRRYLSGYSAEDHAADESAGVLLISKDEQVMLASATNLPWARAEAEAFEPITWERPWATFVGDEITKRRWATVGFEDATTTVADYTLIREKVDGAAELRPLGAALDDLRAIKTADELRLIERVTQMTDEAFALAMNGFRAGMTEREMADVVGGALKNVGSEGEGFSTIVASGPNAAKPHHPPGDRVIQPGEPVIIDMGAKWAGYNGDLTRTVWAGSPDARLVELYGIVHEAQKAAKASAKAGASGFDVDLAARQVFEQHGMVDAFVHGVGHGLGLRVHESPSAGPKSQGVLAAGQVLTIEPGVYFDDWGGVRIEDVVIIEDGGCRNLTGAAKNQV